MIEQLKQCNLCAYNCKINRIEGQIGKCGVGNKIKVALATLHYYEEPCISKENGSGAIFFSNCNFNCIYCQNYKISQEKNGIELEIEELANKFIELQNIGANNINLVSPTPYVYHIIEAIDIARKKGLNIPIIYNTNSYENEETINLLKGYVDVYLPDLKYYRNEIAKKYSGINNYFEVATKAIKKMYEQVGGVVFNEKGIIEKGVIIRHLVLPNHILNSKNVLHWIKENMPEDVYVSVMAQYFPTYKAKLDPLINRKLTRKRI